jgi:hypothetical protein
MKSLLTTRVSGLGFSRSRIWAQCALWAIAPSVLSLSALAQTDNAAQQKMELRLPELRTWVRQPQSATQPNARHLSALERAELRKQLTRELRAQATVSASR